MAAHLRRGMQDFRVRHPHHLPPLARRIHNRQAQHHTDLRRAHAHARHGLHRVDHIGPCRAHLVGDFRNFRGFGAQAFIGIWQATADCHR